MNLTRRNTVFGIVFLKVIAVIFATEVFARFTPLVDSQLYLQGTIPRALDLRTVIPNEVGSFLNAVAGPFFAHLVFALFSVIGLIYHALRGRCDFRLVLCLLLPSSMVWTSIVGKEAIFSGAFVMLIVLWARSLRNSLQIFDWFLVLVSFTICWIFRPHYTLCLIWIFASLILIKTEKYSNKWLLVPCFLGYLAAIKIFVWDKLTSYAFKALDISARASRHEYLGFDLSASNGLVASNYNIFLEAVPVGLIFGILGPLPNELFERYVFIPFFIEGLFISLAPIIVYFLGVGATSKKCERLFFKNVFWLCVFPAILVSTIVHAPFGILNPGSAIRWRTNFEAIFYLAPLLLYFETTALNGQRQENY